MADGTKFACDAVRTSDERGEYPCIRDRHADTLHRDQRGEEWCTPGCTHEYRRAALPYTSHPKTGRGIRVMRTGRTVLVAGQAYTPGAALELSAAIARAANDIAQETRRD